MNDFPEQREEKREVDLESDDFEYFMPEQIEATENLSDYVESIISLALSKKFDRLYHRNDAIFDILKKCKEDSRRKKSLEALIESRRELSFQEKIIRIRNEDGSYFSSFRELKSYLAPRIAEILTPFYVSRDGSLHFSAAEVEKCLSFCLANMAQINADVVLRELKEKLERDHASTRDSVRTAKNPAAPDTQPLKRIINHSSLSTAPVNLNVIREHLHRERQSRKQRREIHRPHTENDMDLIERMRVRLATKADIQTYMDIENEQVLWRDEIDRITKETGLPKDINSLDPRHVEALNRFHREGGHISRYSEKKIRHILRHGAIALIEFLIKDDIYVTLGTVSALFPPPCTPIPEDRRELYDHLDTLFPNFDLRGILVSRPILEKFISYRNELMLICRSTTRSKISVEHLEQEASGKKILERLGETARSDLKAIAHHPLRRMGLAARGKDEFFHMVHEKGFTGVTFNIGYIQDQDKGIFKMGNDPSLKHNSWIRPIGFRNYVDEIIPGLIRMSWQVRMEEITEGINAFERKNGILEGKGYDLDEIRTSAVHNLAELEKRIKSQKHAPLTSKD